MTEQEIRRRGEIFFLWLSVLSVIVGYALTSTASSDRPNDIWFITGVISGFTGSILAFGFVLYISFCSEYHYQKTVSVKSKTLPLDPPENGKKEAVPQECQDNGKKEAVPQECQDNGKKEAISQEFQDHGKKETVPRRFTENGKRETILPEYLEAGNRESVPQKYLLNEKKETVLLEDQEKRKTVPHKLPEEKMNFSINNCQQFKTDSELEKLQQAEYQEVQDILNKATKMLEEFSLVAKTFKTYKEQNNCKNELD